MAKKNVATLKWLTNLIDEAGHLKKYCTSGTLPPLDPCVYVEGVGRVKLPVVPKQAKELMAVGRVAPFGKGTKTLVDTKVRKTIEIDESQIQLSEKWNAMIANLVSDVAVELGLEGEQLEASLYKMLLYEKGGHFQRHRDSEKKSRMVASLIVMLPTEFHGGELVIRHEGSRESFAFDAARKCDSPCYVAFYADCEHEVNRVHQGRRVCLAYNLVLKKSRKKVTRKNPGSEAEVLDRSIQAYVAKQPAEPLAFAFEHQYTQKGLKRDLLKGADRELADVVVAAAEKASCRAYLAQIERHLVQSAFDGSWGYQSRGSYRNVDVGELEIGEEIEDELYAAEWRDLSGKKQPFGSFALANASIVSKTPLDDWKPTTEEYEGYTGNAGNTLDRWYHRSAIVLWRDDHHFDIVARSGCHVSIPIFDSMVSKLAKVSARKYEDSRLECYRFASAILRRWPRRGGYSHRYDGGKDDQPWLAEFVATVARFGQIDLTRMVLSVMIERDKSTSLDKCLSNASGTNGLESFEDDLVRLLASSISEYDKGLAPREFAWLSRLALESRQEPSLSVLKRLGTLATRRFIESYAGSCSPGGMEIKVVCGCLEHLLKALVALGCVSELTQVIEAVEAIPERFTRHAQQADCLINVIGWCRKAKRAIPTELLAWLNRVREDLTNRTQVRPTAPTTWARPAVLKCTCRHCTALNRFLSDSAQETTRIAAAEHQRDHIAGEVRVRQADLSVKLDRSGRPYSLVLTKTTGSHEREVKQFEQDGAVLRKLDSLLPTELSEQVAVKQKSKKTL